MAPSKRRKLVAIGFIAVVLAVALLGRPRGVAQRTGAGPALLLQGHRAPVHALAFGPDGTTLTSAAYHFGASAAEVEVTTWDVATGQPTAQRIAPLRSLHRLALAPGGRAAAASGHDKSLWLWETAGSGGQRELGARRSIVCSLAFSGDGSQLAAGDFEDVVTLWDLAGGRPRAFAKGAVSALAFAPDGKTLAGGLVDSTVGLWDVATGEQQGVLRGHAHAVVTSAFAPDGRTLASGDLGGVVKLWDVAERAERANLASPVDEVTALAFAPNGRVLALAGDRVVRLWDVGSGKFVGSLEGHEGKVMCLAYSPDGTRLATGGHDRTVRLWDMAGKP
jgi:WD40 repeat protein